MYNFVKIPTVLIKVTLFISILSGCASNKIPENASIVAPSGIVSLKGKYSASLPTALDIAGSKKLSEMSVQKEEKRGGSYILGAGDSLTVVLNQPPNSAYDIIIRPDGYISLPIVDDVKAAGLTPTQLDVKLTAFYSKRIVNPEVSVMVRSARQPMVYVLGEVRSPSSIPFMDATSAAEAIARVGDMLPSAYENGIIIIRLDKDGVLRPIAVNSNLKTDQEIDDDYQVSPYLALAATQLEPEDILFIPEKGSSQLGTHLEQLFKPVTVTGGAINSVLSPILSYKIIKSLDQQQDNISIGAQ